MMAKVWILSVLTIGYFVHMIDGKVEVSFKLHSYENLNHIELDGGCCDTGCGSCDNLFNLCFDIYDGNNDMSDCAYGAFQTDRIYENNDNFDFPVSLSSNLTNPIIFTIDLFQTGFLSKIEVWDYDAIGSDDKIDYYGNNYAFNPVTDRTADLAATHSILLAGAGESLMEVRVKLYCALHYYDTDSGCTTYCVAQNDTSGHYDCNDITGAKMCHPGWEGSNCHVEIDECESNPCQNGTQCTNLLDGYSCDYPERIQVGGCDSEWYNTCDTSAVSITRTTIGNEDGSLGHNCSHGNGHSIGFVVTRGDSSSTKSPSECRLCGQPGDVIYRTTVTICSQP